MSQRLLLPLLAALALLCGGVAAAAASAANPASPPSGRIAVDDAFDEVPPGDDAECPEEFLIEDEDGSLVCDDEAWLDDEIDVCEDDGWFDDDEWADDEWVDEDALIARAAATDDICDEELAPRIRALRATAKGKRGRQRVLVSFRLDRAGTLRLTLARAGASKRCARGLSKRAARGKRGSRGRCVRLTPVRGRLAVNGKRGANALTLPRRWNGRALPAGTYRLTLTPVAEGGVPATTSFTLAAKPRR